MHSAFTKFLASQQSRINLFCHYTAFARELTHLFHASAHNIPHRQLLTSWGHQCPTLSEQPHCKFNLSSTLSGRSRRKEVYPIYFASSRTSGFSKFPSERTGFTVSLAPFLAMNGGFQAVPSFPQGKRLISPYIPYKR